MLTDLPSPKSFRLAETRHGETMAGGRLMGGPCVLRPGGQMVGDSAMEGNAMWSQAMCHVPLGRPIAKRG